MRFILSAIFSLYIIGGSPVIAEQGVYTPFSIGAIADCQFADQDYVGKRYYRQSPAKLNKAVIHLNKLNLDYVVHLGDFIDTDFQSFEKLLPITNRLTHPLYHVLGNHDFSVADNKKKQVPEKLNMPARYYSFKHKGWRFIITDGNDVSMHGWAKNSSQYAQAVEAHKNQYADRETWNGALSETQIKWIKSELEQAEEADEKVALYSHFPIYPTNEHNLWNDNDILKLVSSFNVVKLWLNGHNHDGNYDEYKGIHFLTLKGMVDTKETSYSTIEFGENKILVRGFGRQESMVLTLK
ncbi:MAG: hypothetical protein HOH19_07600 [Kordiimonadaceae bacterium]|jgi:manganese-dependent ADP-ribose/CDP-alcohol diphosphatase|nr:hypothetical protein [Kordiimonadaceae bacterium]MBT6032423.1 hypothetical protein [Kordiimonadaceae bacterium]